jgi:hypothetical protein
LDDLGLLGAFWGFFLEKKLKAGIGASKNVLGFGFYVAVRMGALKCGLE